MANSWNGPTISDLNYYMKNRPSGIIVPDLYEWGTLDDHLKKNLRKDAFYGDMVEALIQTSHAHTGTAFGENVDIPYPDDFGFVKMWIPLKECIVNAGITMQALRRATGGNSSWGSAIEHVLKEQKRDWMWLREITSIGDGTGRLARIHSATGGTSPVLTVDNTYSDFGWENTALIKPGMWVEIWDAGGAQIGDVATTGAATGPSDGYFRVKSVTFGDRNNGAATTGTITLEDTTNDLTSTTNSLNENGAMVYLAGTRSLGLKDSAGTGSGTAAAYAATHGTALTCALPMGLVGLVQSVGKSVATHSYDDDSIDCTLSTFQGIAVNSTTYPTLHSQIYRAGDFGGTDLTPDEWHLSVIDDAIEQNYKNTGKKTDLLLCSGQLARAIDRMNRSDNNITTTTNNTAGQRQSVYGSRYAMPYISPIDGAPIPIEVSYTIPRNCLYGLCTEDLHWDTKGDFDFLRLNGEIWDKSYDDRKANFEAPFGGMENRWCSRRDSQWLIQDMRDDI